MNNNNLEYFKEWQKKADEDFESVKILLENYGIPAIICYHCQQVVEKYLKGYLVYNNVEFPKIHQLDLLLEETAKINKEFIDYADEVAPLNNYYIEARYPMDMKEDISIDEAKVAFEAASRIRDFVLSKIETKNH